MTTLVAQNFDSFVFAQNDEIKTTSLLVAEKFGKLHKDVLRKIENLECSKDFTERNFTLCHKINELQNGKPQPFYEMTKDGFMFLVMGFTGKAAAEIKEAYINAFNFMLAKLKPVPNALRDLPPQTLTPAMLRHIEKRIAHLNKTQVGSTYASLGRLIKEKFNVNERKAIPIHKYREVCALLGCEPDEKALQGELVEPAKLEYQPPKGMVLISESELADLKKPNYSQFPSFTLGGVTNQTIITRLHGETLMSFVAEKGTMIGTPEKIIADLQDLGFLVIKNEPEHKLETIEKIVSAKFEA